MQGSGTMRIGYRMIRFHHLKTTFPPRVRGPETVLFLSPFLVALTTWLLSHVQTLLITHEGGHYVRPYGIGYVIPIALLAVLGGWRAGLFTLALSLLAESCFLFRPRFSFTLHDGLDIIELAFLCLVGALLIAGGESMRRNVRLLHANKEAAEREKRAAEREKALSEQQRRFLRDVMASVTDNRLQLRDDPAELPVPAEPVGEPIHLSAQDVRTLREKACEAALGAGLSKERCYDLMTAVSEAAMNAVVHGGGGEGRIYVQEDKVQVWVKDEGRGIDIDQLPRATLERGHSTAGTLGHGFWLMLRMADRLWLVTGETGTIVVLEQERTPPVPTWQ